ncbi:hypothetical protein L4C33_21790 [Vibrio makurazakiensis]|uniref:hypothetical protein n=1 Tax=Vibrio makurazakiensis TaxID=2910250 RepID=UPI003D0D2719
MVHISQVLPLINKHLKELKPQEAVQFKTYKKDRGFIIYCLNSSQFQIVENGFCNASTVLDSAKILKSAKKVLKREFPRSNKVWVEYFQNLESPFDIKATHSMQMSLF